MTISRGRWKAPSSSSSAVDQSPSPDPLEPAVALVRRRRRPPCRRLPAQLRPDRFRPQGAAAKDARLLGCRRHQPSPGRCRSRRRARRTLLSLIIRATDRFRCWQDPKNSRAIPHRLQECGYVKVRNPDAEDGLWRIDRKRQAIYARADLPLRDQLTAAAKLAGRQWCQWFSIFIHTLSRARASPMVTVVEPAVQGVREWRCEPLTPLTPLTGSPVPAVRVWDELTKRQASVENATK